MKEIGKGGVEEYLRIQVEAAGGMCEKHTSPGRKNVPDRLVSWPHGTIFAGAPTTIGFLELVETKAPGKKPNTGQVRDHKRRAEMGIRVLLIDTKEKVDRYVQARRPDYSKGAKT